MYIARLWDNCIKGNWQTASVTQLLYDLYITVNSIRLKYLRIFPHLFLSLFYYSGLGGHEGRLIVVLVSLYLKTNITKYLFIYFSYFCVYFG